MCALIRLALFMNSPRCEGPGSDINDAIRDVIELTRAETVKNDVAAQTELAIPLPLVNGYGVKLQQVVLNLIVNAEQGTSLPSGRENRGSAPSKAALTRRSRCRIRHPGCLQRVLREICSVIGYKYHKTFQEALRNRLRTTMGIADQRRYDIASYQSAL